MEHRIPLLHKRFGRCASFYATAPRHFLNMYTKIYWIHEFDNSARIGIMARPRGDEWLEDEIVKIKKQNVGLLVSLLEQKEVSELGLNKQKEFCEKNNIDFINFPIVDRGIPKKSDELNTLISQLTEKVNKGLSIVIHCRMGIGRSSIIAACILHQAGLKTDAIIQKITKVRGLKVPDTDEQVRWLKDREKNERTTVCL